MRTTLPMFPLNTVLFPGVVVPLWVFEPRYRALVQHLLRDPDPTTRCFGSVAVREGYEVGEHGAQSLFRVGCRLQLTDVAGRPDGSYDIQAVCRDRIRLHDLDPTGPFPSALVSDVPSTSGQVSGPILERALATSHAYRIAVAEVTADPYPDALPQDPEYLSWTLAAAAPLPVPDRQELLETDDTELRLTMVTDLLRGELLAMRVLPSLPATEVARSRWSPN